MDTQLITRDLIHATKGTIHVMMGNSELGQVEYDKIKDTDSLPDFDDIPNDEKIVLYNLAWKELREEGCYE